jgi:hypothetical protein
MISKRVAERSVAGSLAVLLLAAAPAGLAGEPAKDGPKDQSKAQVTVNVAKTPAVNGLQLSIYRTRNVINNNVPRSVAMEGPGMASQGFEPDDVVWYAFTNTGNGPLMVPGHMPSFRICARDADGKVYAAGICGRGSTAFATDDHQPLESYVVLAPGRELRMAQSGYSVHKLPRKGTYALWFEFEVEPKEIVPGLASWAGKVKSNEITCVLTEEKENAEPWAMKPVEPAGAKPKPEEQPKPPKEPAPEQPKPAPPPDKPAPRNPAEDF